MAHAHADHADSAGEFEPDVQDKDMTTIGIYFVVLSALFFASLGGLFLYFRYEADLELERKINHHPSQRLEEMRAADQAALSGKSGGTSIDDAMKSVVQEMQNAKGK